MPKIEENLDVRSSCSNTETSIHSARCAPGEMPSNRAAAGQNGSLRSMTPRIRNSPNPVSAAMDSVRCPASHVARARLDRRANEGAALHAASRARQAKSSAAQRSDSGRSGDRQLA